MTLTGTSERGLSLVGKHGFILVKCYRADQAHYIRNNVENIDWENKGLPELVNVSSRDENVWPHIEVRTMDGQATFQDIIQAVENHDFRRGTHRMRHLASIESNEN